MDDSHHQEMAGLYRGQRFILATPSPPSASLIGPPATGPIHCRSAQNGSWCPFVIGILSESLWQDYMFVKTIFLIHLMPLWKQDLKRKKYISVWWSFFSLLFFFAVWTHEMYSRVDVGFRITCAHQFKLGAHFSSLHLRLNPLTRSSCYWSECRVLISSAIISLNFLNSEDLLRFCG